MTEYEEEAAQCMGLEEFLLDKGQFFLQIGKIAQLK